MEGMSAEAGTGTGTETGTGGDADATTKRAHKLVQRAAASLTLNIGAFSLMSLRHVTTGV